MNFTHTRKSGIIVGAMAMDGDIYDGRTLKPQLDQVKNLTDGKVKNSIVGKGCMVPGGIPGVDIGIPKEHKGESNYNKENREERCKSRTVIEVLISQLNQDHRMIRKFLSGSAVDKDNTLLDTSVNNMKKRMRVKRQRLLELIFAWNYQRHILAPVVFIHSEYMENKFIMDQLKTV